MMVLAVTAIVLVVVLALKVVSIMATRDEIVGNSVAFSWVDAREQHDIPTWEADAREGVKRGTSVSHVRSYGRRARVA